MTIWDAIGFAAAAMVLLAFYQKRMMHRQADGTTAGIL
jgi:hypothetical protein